MPYDLNSWSVTTKSVTYDNAVVDNYHSSWRCASLNKQIESTLVMNIQFVKAPQDHWRHNGVNSFLVICIQHVFYTPVRFALLSSQYVCAYNKTRQCSNMVYVDNWYYAIFVAFYRSFNHFFFTELHILSMNNPACAFKNDERHRWDIMISSFLVFCTHAIALRLLWSIFFCFLNWERWHLNTLVMDSKYYVFDLSLFMVWIRGHSRSVTEVHCEK